MNGDKNNNGVPDGEELDGDEDGLPDLIDAMPRDVTVAWEATPPTRFAFFPVDGPAPPPGEVARAALQINNQGCVLFPTALWKEGALLTLRRVSRTGKSAIARLGA